MPAISRWLPIAENRLSHRSLSARHIQMGVLIAGLCLVAAAWAALGYHLAQREAALREQAYRDVRNLSIAVEKHVERLVVGVDQVLQYMAADFADEPAGFDFGSWLKRSTSLEAVTHQISMYDEAGGLVASRFPLAPGMPRFDVLDRAYFQALAARADLGLYIDRTLKGRLTGRYVFQTARRLTRRDGSFAGVIVSSIDPEYLSRQFAALDIGPGGSIGVFGHDGYIRARHPQVNGMYEKNVTALNNGRGVFEHLKDAPEGNYEVASAFDGRTRLFGYRTVGNLPLVVTVSRPLDEVLAPYVQERDRVLLAGLGFTAVSLAVMLILMRGLEFNHRQGISLADANRTLLEQKEVARSAEARASEANRSLRLAAQIAHVGHWRVDLPSNRLAWSDEVFRIYGLPDTQTPSVADAIAGYHPDDRAMVARYVDEAVHHGRAFDFSARVVQPDESVRDVVCRGLCESGSDGTIIALFGTFMDVTELRSAERALGKSEALYRLLADNSSDMITRMDLTGRRLFVSSASQELLGYGPEELVGTSPQGMIHPDDAVGLGNVLANLAAGRQEQAINVNRLRHRDGSWVWVEASLRLLRDREGVAAGMIASIRNVTDRKQAEQSLRESEHRFRLLAENTSELIMLGHDDGRRSYVSPAAQRLLGFSSGELAAMRLRDYVHPDDLGRLYETTARLGKDVPEVVCVYRALNRHTGWISVEGTFRRIPDAQDDEPSIVATFRDVTERELQAELLEQAAVAAEAGARIQAEFLANMSHELRTPLTGMLGVHDLLRSDPSVSDRQRHLIGLAHDSGRSLLAIVNDILDFSKIEAGQLALEALPFSLRNLLDGCRQLARETIKGNPVVLEVVIPDAVPDWFVGDTTRLRQVLLNLLTNAAKFTSEGRITVTASYDANGKGLHIDVADTGIGIPADKLPLLFARFSQADASTSRRYGGTGLGLAICKRLVELMGGDIGVVSEPKRGSAFWFSVPLPSAEGASEAATVTTLLSLPSGRGYRLLVAEDNAVNQQILQGVLEQQGHSLMLVGDGDMALKARQSGGPFDMILMDVQMPGLDGIDATRAIRVWEREAGHNPIPIIALTANTLPEEVIRCREAGMDAHVAKPIDWGALSSTMDRLQVGREDQELHAGSRALPDALVLDFALLEELAGMLGSKAMSRLMASFVAEIRKRVVAMDKAPAAEVVRHAHVLVALAGQLGFTELSVFCAGLEQTAQAGEALGDIGALPVIVERALRAAAATPYARALAA